MSIAAMTGRQRANAFWEARTAKLEDEYWSGLMYNAMSPDTFDLSDPEQPVYRQGAAALPSKDAAYRQYLMMKGGRLNSQELMAFHQGWEAMEAQRNTGQLNELNKLQLAGVSDKKIRKMVKANPALYSNLLDMTSKLSGKGDEESAAMAGRLQGFLPGKGTKQKMEEFVEKHPVGSLAAIGATSWVATKYGPVASEKLTTHFLTDKDAVKVFEDYINGKYVKNDAGKWTFGKGHKLEGKTLDSNKFYANTHKKLQRLESAAGPQWKNIFKSRSMIPKGLMSSITGLGWTFAPGVGEMVAGDVGKDIGHGVAGAYFTKSAITRGSSFLAKMGARHAAAASTGVGAHPVVQGGLLLLDLGLAVNEIMSLFSDD